MNTSRTISVRRGRLPWLYGHLRLGRRVQSPASRRTFSPQVLGPGKGGLFDPCRSPILDIREGRRDRRPSVRLRARRVSRRIQSATLQADAKHSWLDTLSSLGALIGLLVVATGRRWGDPMAGFVVTLFIIPVGVTVTREITRHLMDGVDPADVRAAPEAALQVGAWGRSSCEVGERVARWCWM